MTPAEIETMARQKYNAIGDTNWSSSEIMSLIYAGCMELAIETYCIEQTFSTTVVQSQREYDFPTNVIKLKRIEYDGKKLTKVTFREDDYTTGRNANATQEGTPEQYSEWNETIYLRPIPDNSTSTLKVFGYIEPQAVTLTSVLEIPTRYHLSLVDYVLEAMHSKDKDFNSAQIFGNKWIKAKDEAKKHERRKTKGDTFAAVQDDEQMQDSTLRSV